MIWAHLARLGIALITLSIIGCASRAPRTSLPEWRAPHQRAHPLVGTIYETATGAELSAEALLQQLRGIQADEPLGLLLGELHDHPDHHQLQAWLIRALSPAEIGFEMLDERQEAALAGLLEQAPTRWGETLQWTARGWPDFEIYRPIFEAAAARGAKLFAAHPTPAALFAVAKEGLSAVPDATEIGLGEPLSAELDAALNAELVKAHCGLLPSAMIPKMALAQRVKDARLAEALLRAIERVRAQSSPGDGKALVVMIGGRGHFRNDRALPHVLRARQSALKTRSIAFTPVEEGKVDVAEYAAPFDYIWFTPAHHGPEHDPCAELRARFQGHHQRGAGR